jgi:hypothetical protein
MRIARVSLIALTTTMLASAGQGKAATIYDVVTGATGPTYNTSSGYNNIAMWTSTQDRLVGIPLIPNIASNNVFSLDQLTVALTKSCGGSCTTFSLEADLWKYDSSATFGYLNTGTIRTFIPGLQGYAASTPGTLVASTVFSLAGSSISTQGSGTTPSFVNLTSSSPQSQPISPNVSIFDYDFESGAIYMIAFSNPSRVNGDTTGNQTNFLRLHYKNNASGTATPDINSNFIDWDSSASAPCTTAASPPLTFSDSLSCRDQTIQYTRTTGSGSVTATLAANGNGNMIAKLEGTISTLPVIATPAPIPFVGLGLAFAASRRLRRKLASNLTSA